MLRFDFTGLGSSEGEFQNTSFSSNVEDLVRAADHLRKRYRAPTLVIGHSLGGAAVLAAADRLPEAKAIVTISAPSDVAHVLQHFGAKLDDIERDGIANVTLAGRTFPISRTLLEDAKGHALQQHMPICARPCWLRMPQRPDRRYRDATTIFVAASIPKFRLTL